MDKVLWLLAGAAITLLLLFLLLQGRPVLPPPTIETDADSAEVYSLFSLPDALSNSAITARSAADYPNSGRISLLREPPLQLGKATQHVAPYIRVEYAQSSVVASEGARSKLQKPAEDLMERAGRLPIHPFVEGANSSWLVTLGKKPGL